MTFFWTSGHADYFAYANTLIFVPGLPGNSSHHHSNGCFKLRNLLQWPPSQSQCMKQTLDKNIGVCPQFRSTYHGHTPFNWINAPHSWSVDLLIPFDSKYFPVLSEAWVMEYISLSQFFTLFGISTRSRSIWYWNPFLEQFAWCIKKSISN